MSIEAVAWSEKLDSDNLIIGPSLKLLDSSKILSKCSSTAYVPRSFPLKTNGLK